MGVHRAPPTLRSSIKGHASRPSTVEGFPSAHVGAVTMKRLAMLATPYRQHHKIAIWTITAKRGLRSESGGAKRATQKLQFALKPSIPVLGFTFLHYPTSPDLEAMNSLRFFSGTIVRRPILLTFKLPALISA